MVLYPFLSYSSRCVVLVVTSLHFLKELILHHVLKLEQPGFNSTSNLHWPAEVYLLSLVGDHSLKYFIIYLNVDQVIEAGLQVLSNDVEVLRVGQNFKKLIIG